MNKFIHTLVLAMLQSHFVSLRRQAVRILASQPIPDQSTLEVLLAALRHSNWYVQEAVIKALMKQPKNQELIDSLVDLLSDNDAKVRLAAVRALGRVGDARAVEPLITFYKKTSFDIAAWGEVIDALGLIGGAQAIPFLEQILRSTEGVWDPDGIAASMARAVSNALIMINQQNTA